MAPQPMLVSLRPVVPVVDAVLARAYRQCWRRRFRVVVGLHRMVVGREVPNDHAVRGEAGGVLRPRRDVVQCGPEGPHAGRCEAPYGEGNNGVLKEKGVELLPWAPYSPDWNIDQIWAPMKRELDVTCFTKREDLIAEVLSVWEDEQTVIDHMCLDFGNRLVRLRRDKR
jgi:hypothetical protein